MAHEIVVGTVGDIAEGTCRIVTADGRQIGIFNVGGSYYALLSRCPHQGGPLCEGRISGTLRATSRDGEWTLEWGSEGEIVSCPWHGLEFSIRTGECLAHPGRRVPTFPVSARDGTLVLTMEVAGTPGPIAPRGNGVAESVFEKGV